MSESGLLSTGCSRDRPSNAFASENVERYPQRDLSGRSQRQGNGTPVVLTIKIIPYADTVHRLHQTAAMDLLQAGVILAVIALSLGHESVETTPIYLEPTLTKKE